MRCAVLGSPISALPLAACIGRPTTSSAWTGPTTRSSSRPTASGDFLGRPRREWRGLSLTMPLKRMVVPMRRHASTPGSRTSGVANTVLARGRSAGWGSTPTSRGPRPRSPSCTRRTLGGGPRRRRHGDVGAARARRARLLRRVELLVRDPARAVETVAVVRSQARAPEVTVSRIDEASRSRRTWWSPPSRPHAQSPVLLAGVRLCPSGLRRRLRPVADPAGAGRSRLRAGPRRPGSTSWPTRR